jgi:CubicO group peptidase (beta-lactamase class C family)
VLLALMVERVLGQSFEDIVQDLVLNPAEMAHTGFVRSDRLPGDVAIGYMTSENSIENKFWTNALHLPVMGSGDGGLFSTAADMHTFWLSVTNESIVSAKSWREMTRAHSVAAQQKMRYGLGFWLHESGPAIVLEGMDAGISFCSVHDPGKNLTYSVIANTSSGAWPVARKIERMIDGLNPARG